MSSMSIANSPTRSFARPKAARFSLRWPQDRWLTATGLTATVTSVLAFWYAYQHHLILLYNDAFSHLVIARRVFDNAAPGLSQLGGVWLPLPHLIMMPFIWNDALLRSGLAGSFSSMPCYIISAIFLFLSVRRLTHDSRASYIGALVFILNPNMLYLQTTPLSEPVLLATMTGSCYFFLAWVQSEDLKHLIWCGVATFLATLARYDGWVIYLAIMGAIGLICWQRRTTWRKMEDYLLLYGVLGGLGIALWFLWGAMLFHDPLYFQHGPYSAQQQQFQLLQDNSLPDYHNLWRSVHTYLMAAGETIGPLLLITMVVGLFAFLMRRRLSAETLALLPYLAPVVFYAISLYAGQAVLYVPGAAENAPNLFFNARYGILILPPAALLIGNLAQRWPLGQILIALVLGVQAVFTAQGGIITIQDGQHGLSCAPTHATTVFLAQHYTQGLILEDTYVNPQDFASAGVDFHNVIYQGSGETWSKALGNPAAVVDWIIIRPGDEVAHNINYNSPAFLAQYTMVARDTIGIMLFHRTVAPLSNHQLPDGLLTDHVLCTGGVPVNTTTSQKNEHIANP